MAHGTTEELIEVIKGKTERGEPLEFTVNINGVEHFVNDGESWRKVNALALAEFDKANL